MKSFVGIVVRCLQPRNRGSGTAPKRAGLHLIQFVRRARSHFMAARRLSLDSAHCGALAALDKIPPATSGSVLHVDLNLMSAKSTRTECIAAANAGSAVIPNANSAGNK